MSEPEKLKPTATVVITPVSLLDSEIVASITGKSTDIKQSVNKGCTLELCFTKTKEDYKHAVINPFASN